MEDTRTRYEVPVIITAKVQDEAEATELVARVIANAKAVKGVSLSHPPRIVGKPVEVGTQAKRIVARLLGRKAS